LVFFGIIEQAIHGITWNEPESKILIIYWTICLNKVVIQKTNAARNITCKHMTSSITSRRTSATEHLFALYADRHEALYSEDDFRILVKLFLERQQ
jgi:hypothetical protein